LAFKKNNPLITNLKNVEKINRTIRDTKNENEIKEKMKKKQELTT